MEEGDRNLKAQQKDNGVLVFARGTEVELRRMKRRTEEGGSVHGDDLW